MVMTKLCHLGVIRVAVSPDEVGVTTSDTNHVPAVGATAYVTKFGVVMATPALWWGTVAPLLMDASVPRVTTG